MQFMIGGSTTVRAMLLILRRSRTLVLPPITDGTLPGQLSASVSGIGASVWPEACGRGGAMLGAMRGRCVLSPRG
eukprot:10816410-Alexandrium_andersonii.AAC.1